MTTFVRPWSYQWGLDLMFGEGIKTHCAVKMQFIFYTFVHLKEVTQVNIVTCLSLFLVNIMPSKCFKLILLEQ